MANVSNTQMNFATNTNINVNANVNVVSKEYYVKVPNRTKKRYHALKFHTSFVDMATWNKAEMARDLTNQQTQRQDTDSKTSYDAKEQARRKRFGNAPKKINPEDQPWVLTNKSNEKASKQYIGKKSVSENSSYFVFIKCADGGFEAWPLEDWYSFAPHKTYKTLDHEEAEKEYKRRNQVLNKHIIMANRRKTDLADDEENEGTSSKEMGSLFNFGSKSSKDAWVSDGEDDSKKKKKKTNYKSSNLSDDEEDDQKDDNNDEEDLEEKSKSKKKPPRKRKDLGSDDEIRAKEDSDDGDHEGIEKDYSSSDSSLGSEPETSKFEEKYQQKGIDEEEAIKAQNISDESESEEDEEGLTEIGKEYRRKLMAKNEEENESDDFDESNKGKTGKDDDSKDSSSSFDESDLESDIAKQKKNKLKDQADNKLKRKASDELLQNKSKKKQNKNQTTAVTHDESSSSSSTSAAPNMNKSSKTAAVIAAAAANTASAAPLSSNKTASTSKNTQNAGLSEEEVKRYLSRKPMTTKELLHKLKNKTQMTNDQLVNSLRVILDKLKAKMIDQNGVKYLSLS